jgi:thiamine biosynthesis lipoprotein
MIDAWGFTDRSGKRPTASNIELALQAVGWEYLDLDPVKKTIRFTKPGMKLNLGAIGKGYALDRIATRLRTESVADFLLHGGNSSLIASGHSSPERASQERASQEKSDGWLVGLMHPTRANHRIGGLRLRDQGLATSGNGKQFFHFRGQRYGHVIDPRTGYPAGECLSVTVVSPSATAADALATGLFIMPMAEIQRFATEHVEVPILLTLPGERQGEVQVEAFNAPADAYQYS